MLAEGSTAVLCPASPCPASLAFRFLVLSLPPHPRRLPAAGSVCAQAPAVLITAAFSAFAVRQRLFVLAALLLDGRSHAIVRSSRHGT